MVIKVDGTKDDLDFDNNLVEKAKRNRFNSRLAGIFDSTFFALLTLTYIVVSLIMGNEAAGPSGLSAWAVYWPIILLGGMPGGIFRSIYHKRLSLFPIWSVASAAYLFLGMYAGMWHPYWVILLAIPVYYSIVGPIDSLIDDKKKGRI